MDSTAREVIYEGRVQRVGFRATVRQIAKGFDVTGWIENLADGSVKMRVMGETDEVDDFMEDIRNSSLAHHIQNVRDSEIEPMEDVRGFSIRR